MNLKKIYNDYFHGKGYLAYKSEEAQKLFLKGLIKLSEKCFWIPMASLVALTIKPGKESFMIVIVCVVIFISGMVMRHYSLREIDNINIRKSEKEKFKKFRQSHPLRWTR